MKKMWMVSSVAIAATLGLAGCSIPAANVSGGSSSSSPETTLVPTPQPLHPPQQLDLLAFGDTRTWADGVALSVSVPTAYEAGPYAAGVIDGWLQIQYTVTVTNGSMTVLEPFTYGQLTSGGQGASQIFDSGNGISIQPGGVVLPGQSISWVEAFSVADPASLTLQIAPGFQYTDAVFTNIAP